MTSVRISLSSLGLDFCHETLIFAQHFCFRWGFCGQRWLCCTGSTNRSSICSRRHARRGSIHSCRCTQDMKTPHSALSLGGPDSATPTTLTLAGTAKHSQHSQVSGPGGHTWLAVRCLLERGSIARIRSSCGGRRPIAIPWGLPIWAGSCPIARWRHAISWRRHAVHLHTQTMFTQCCRLVALARQHLAAFALQPQHCPGDLGLALCSRTVTDALAKPHSKASFTQASPHTAKSAPAWHAPSEQYCMPMPAAELQTPLRLFFWTVRGQWATRTLTGCWGGMWP